MNNTALLYSQWLERATADEAITKELQSISGNDEEISERFYQSLAFGTGGLRGVIGAGTNRMNIYTVAQATQGVANYLKANGTAKSVAIAHDSRINSDVFAQKTAEVFAGNGFHVYFYPHLVPTPMLSYAVRELKCDTGVIITASHNPAIYNGYKCYDAQGYQMTDDAAAKVYDCISGVDIFDGVSTLDFDKALDSGLIEMIDESLIERFYDAVLSQCKNRELVKDSGLKIIYTPLNGAGNKPVREILKRLGLKEVQVVKEQENPDGNFPTCPYPNPEIRQVFELAIDMAKDFDADLLLATDPDCDRVGIAVKTNDGYKLMSGNEVGVMLTQYLLSYKSDNGTLPENPVVIKSFVTTDLVTRVCEKYGAQVRNLLTGFKYTGELITKMEKDGEAGRFVLGMEESYGYLSGTHARDKDAVVGSALICEMAAYYKTKGMTLYELMQSIYKEHGYYVNELLNFEFAGAAGMQKMQNIMDYMRTNSPKEIGTLKVEKISDYLTGVKTDTATGDTEKINLPKSNVLAYDLQNNCAAIVRPSGTEPKIKVYVTAVSKSQQESAEISKVIGDDMKKMLGVE